MSVFVHERTNMHSCGLHERLIRGKCQIENYTRMHTVWLQQDKLCVCVSTDSSSHHREACQTSEQEVYFSTHWHFFVLSGIFPLFGYPNGLLFVLSFVMKFGFGLFIMRWISHHIQKACLSKIDRKNEIKSLFFVGIPSFNLNVDGM